MSNNEGDVSENVTVKKSRFFQLCHGCFNSLKTSNCIGFISLELKFGDQAQVQDGLCELCLRSP